MTPSMEELIRGSDYLKFSLSNPGAILLHISSLNKYLLSTYYLRGTVLGSVAAKNSSTPTGPLTLVSSSLHFNPFALIFKLPFYSWAGSHPSVLNNF